MEIRMGYKKTDIGVIPEDWNVRKIVEFTNTTAGGTPSTLIDDYWNGNIRWMSSGELHLKKVFDVQGRITEKGLTNSATKLIPPYCVLIGLAGQGKTRGTVAINMVELCTNQSIAAILPCEEVMSEFLYYNLDSRYFEIRNQSTGTGGRGGLNLTIINNLEVALPPTKTEQTIITTALSDVDALISSLEKLIVKKRDIKQGAMQELLKPKSGWVEKPLGELGLITGSGVDKLIKLDEVPVRLLNYLDVFHRDFIYSHDLKQWVTASNQKAKKCAIQKGDIFFTPSSEMRFDIAIPAVAMEDIPDAVYSYHLVRFRLHEDWDLQFRVYIFQTKNFIDQAERVCEGSGKRYVITLPKFRELTVSYPSDKKEQFRISEILSEMDAEVAALETKLEKYKMIKQGMMQTLLTGQIRLI